MLIKCSRYFFQHFDFTSTLLLHRLTNGVLEHIGISKYVFFIFTNNSVSICDATTFMFDDMMLVQLRRPAVYCTVLTVLYCTVLHCTVLYYTILHPRLSSFIFLIVRSLQQIGIPGSIFIHTSGFIGGHATREGALAMAVQVTDYQHIVNRIIISLICLF